MFKILGVIIILWGVADIGLSWAGIDLYAKIGIILPAFLYYISGIIAIVVGGVIYEMDKKSETENE
jgi:hypothetical protein